METVPQRKQRMQGWFRTALICALAAAVLVCTVTFGGERRIPIYCVDTPDKKVAISFDAAWGDEYTAGILDILDTYDVKATFFLVNFWVEDYPDDVKMISEHGHDIGNHSATHPDMAGLSADKVTEELETTGATIEELTGKRPTLFRPPFGSYSDTLIETAESLGYDTVQWSVDSLDWKDISTEQIVDRVTRNVKNGSIILFHNNAQHVLEYLPLILENLKANGYEVVKINDLIYHGKSHVNEQGCQISDGPGKTEASGDNSDADGSDKNGGDGR